MTSPTANLEPQPTPARTSADPRGPVICRHCQKANPAARRFCSACGQSLWEQCPSCQVEFAADERFCGACGVDIAAEIQQQQQACQAAVRAAAQQAALHQYDAALRDLAAVAALSDPRLAACAAQARDAVREIESQREQQTQLAAGALEFARQHFENWAYDRAAETLEQVPATMRTPAHDDLLARAWSCRQELVSLAAEIRAAIEEKRTTELLMKLERLLRLKPNHAQARQMAEQLADNFVKRARQHLARQEYQQALDQLDQMPSMVERDEATALRDTASELASLLAAVKEGALATGELVALADRLCKLAPAHAAAARLRAEIAERAKATPAEPRLGAPNWLEPQKRTPPGPRVEWLAKITRSAAANESIAQTLAEHPGQFFTALGLALCGAGLAATDAKLTPRGKEGLFAKLSTLGMGRRGPVTAWGLDLSEYALKAVRVVAAGEHDVRIDGAEYMLHRQLSALTSSEADRAEILQETLKAFLIRAGELKGVRTCIGVPGQRVLGRFFELPPMPARKVTEAVQYEARHQLPVAIDELCWAFAVQGEQPGKEADQAPRRVLLQAAREAQVRDRMGLFKAAGLPVDLVQSDCLALASALAFEVLADEPAHGAIAAIDVGDACTNVVISSPGRCWFRTFGAGGETFHRDLVRQLELTHEQAGVVLRHPARARRFHEWKAALQPALGQLAGEVERSLATYARANSDRPVRVVYGLGGAFQTLGLMECLRRTN